ncbi:MAG: transporter substrate-binding domain-containing protein [Eubacterium sp.]|nr:transporter substrate-binding domain-containing protein [Eubacterium sp.]
MKKFTKIMALVLAAAFVFACFAGCSAKEETKDTLTLATSADFPPYESIGDDGSYVGIDIEIAQAIADKLGKELVVENMDFDAIINSVSTGKADMGMAGLTVTDERLQSVDFSTSYATGVQAIIVAENSPITSVDDLYAEGAAYKVGVQISTTADIYFSGDIEKGLTTCTVEQYQTGAEAVTSLTTGKIDAVIIDNEPAKSFVAANEGLKILDTKYTEEDYAIAFAKGSELTEEVNNALKELIADGTVQNIIDKYIPAE